MEKSIFNLDEKLVIGVLSTVCILFTFISSYTSMTNLLSFIFTFLKASIFVLIPFFVYILEKNNLKVKKISAIYTSYFIIHLFITIITSISMVNGVVSKLWCFCFDLVNLTILLSSLFILIEQILDYSDIKSKIYVNTVMKIVYLVGNFISYPFISFINKKSGKG